MFEEFPQSPEKSQAEERLANLQKRKRAEQKARQQVFMILFAVGIVLVIGIAAYIILNRPPQVPQLAPDFDYQSVPDNSVEYPIVGFNHIPSDAPHHYNSNPPTSGDHNAQWITPLGVYGQLPDDNLVHNLEHGHVWLSYRDANDKEALALLTEIFQKYPERTIVTYRPEDDTRIAAASWGYLLTLDKLDRAQIEAFIIRHSDHARESLLEPPANK